MSSWQNLKTSPPIGGDVFGPGPSQLRLVDPTGIEPVTPGVNSDEVAITSTGP